MPARGRGGESRTRGGHVFPPGYFVARGSLHFGKDLGHMVNEERLRHMIKMAQFDTRDGDACKPMMQYARKDYISMRLLGSFVSGTACFMVLLGMWGLYSMERLVAEINQMDIRALIETVVVLYLLFMAAYLAVTYVVFHVKYTAGRRKVKRYYASVKKVNQMYEREGRAKGAGTDWD